MPPRDWHKYTTEEREESVLKQRKWRQTHNGKRLRNISHWRHAKIREPEEGWIDFYENKFFPATNCALCKIDFGDNGHRSDGKCLDHHHASGYMRNIVCRRCNISCMPMYDKKISCVLLELHRYHFRN